MTLQNANPVFYDEGEQVSTGPRTYTLNPDAPVFVPPQRYNSTNVNSFMNEDGLQSSCGDAGPTRDISSSDAMKSGDNEMPCVTNDIQATTMTEEEMVEAGASTPQEEMEGEGVSDMLPPTEPVIPMQELSKEKIMELVLQQVPFFFSRENWSSEPYLLSQMDSDQYVPIRVLASCSQFKQITKNHFTIMDALKKSELVQLDLENNRVRPNYKRCIVILREIPESTPPSEIEGLFAHEDCPKVISSEFINNDSWYVTFDNDDDAQKAYRHLREVVKTFKEKPIAARIKTKPLTRNCFAVLPPQPKQQNPQQSNGNGPPAVAPSSISQPTVSSPYIGTQRMYFPAGNNPYNYYQNVSSPLSSATPAYFYPNPMMQWHGQNGNFYDMNSFLHYNGLSPKATFKPSTSAVRFPAGNHNTTTKAGKKSWDRAEPRSQSVTGNTASGGRVSLGPRTSTASTISFSTNPVMNVGGQVRPDGFSNQNNFVQNDISTVPNQGMYASYSPPVTTDVDSERTTDVSPLVSGDYTAAFMPTAPYEAPVAAAQMVPITYSPAFPGPVLYRNGFGNDQRAPQRNNGGVRRKPRRDDEMNATQSGRGSYQRGYSSETSSKMFQDRRKPQFNLQATSFPPLPGSDEGATENVVPEDPVEAVAAAAWNVDTQKFSDVMKGTARGKSEKIDSPTATISTTSVTAVSSKLSQSGAVDATSQVIHKPKPATLMKEICDEGSIEQVAAVKAVVPQARVQTQPQARVQIQKEPRVEERKATGHDTCSTSRPKGRKEATKLRGGDKENRPNSAVRPNMKEENVREEGWNRVRGNRTNIPLERPLTETVIPKKTTLTNLKETKPLTNGDISPPPGLPRIENDNNKQRNEKPAQDTNPRRNCFDVKQELIGAQSNVSAEGNSMSWAKMAKNGKDEMEKLSAVIKEKEEQERIKKSRTVGRPQVKPTQDKIVLGKETRPFRRDLKEKPTETKPADKNVTPTVRVREFRSKSPKPQ